MDPVRRGSDQVKPQTTGSYALHAFALLRRALLRHVLVRRAPRNSGLTIFAESLTDQPASQQHVKSFRSCFSRRLE
jgi:hypothetical protein